MMKAFRLSYIFFPFIYTNFVSNNLVKILKHADTCIFIFFKNAVSSILNEDDAFVLYCIFSSNFLTYRLNTTYILHIRYTKIVTTFKAFLFVIVTKRNMIFNGLKTVMVQKKVKFAIVHPVFEEYLVA